MLEVAGVLPSDKVATDSRLRSNPHSSDQAPKLRFVFVYILLKFILFVAIEEFHQDIIFSHQEFHNLRQNLHSQDHSQRYLPPHPRARDCEYNSVSSITPSVGISIEDLTLAYCPPNISMINVNAIFTSASFKSSPIFPKIHFLLSCEASLTRNVLTL